MANDVVFKTKAFGGFNKDEVMDFVNKVLEEKINLQKAASEANAKCVQANAMAEEYKQQAEEAVKLKDELTQLQNKLSQLEETIASKDEEINSLKISAEAKDNEIAELKIQAENAKLSEEAQSEIEALKSEVSRLKIECEKKRDIERQVGAAMLDARVHSEELVEAAKERANTVTKSVYSAIGETALKIDDLSTGIGEIARSFTKSVEEVELRIKALTGDMSKTAQLLISDSGIINESSENTTPEVEYDFLDEASGNSQIDYGVNE